MATFVGQNDIILVDFMTKRSQMKSRFKSENFKGRWFVLTSKLLSYHDGNIEDGKQGKMKGEIYLGNVKAVETVDPEQMHRKPLVFQVVYTDDSNGEVYTLYVIALTSEQRDQWMSGILETCLRCGAELYDKYHTGVYNHKAGHWTCCHNVQRSAVGCENTVYCSKKTPANFKRITTQPLPDVPVQTRPTPTPRVTPNKNNKNPPLPPRPRPATQIEETSSEKVLALFDYDRAEEHDLELIKGEEYEVLDSTSHKQWLLVKNKKGVQGYVPANYVKKLTEQGLDMYDWYYPNLSRSQGEELLRDENQEGCFVVRDSSAKGMYTLSIFAKEKTKNNTLQGVVKNYHIKKDEEDKFYLTEKHSFETIPELIHYHKHNAAGLISRLRSCPADKGKQPATAGLAFDKWEINSSDLSLFETLGSGQFGEVRRATWRSKEGRMVDVAVKMMKEDTMSDQDFIDEARVMQQLQNDNLVQLYGVCTSRPIMIVTEYMKHGALLSYLRKRKERLADKSQLLLEMCIQVCKAMVYLEDHQFIHRDLAARNCLVSETTQVKVGDFGLARFVLDDEYTSSHGTKFPIRWAPPEVLQYTKFSTKSDVWSFGILMWEVFTLGDMPYGKVKHATVIDWVCHRKKKLDQPTAMPDAVYDIALNCWELLAADRPDFKELCDRLIHETTADYMD